MPIIKAAKKYMRVTKRKTLKNNKIKGQFKSAIKNTKTALAKGEIDKAQEYLKKSMKALDKAIQKKVLTKNGAARMKSRLNKQVKKAVRTTD
ncbi:MAG: 30S ribosomal protein S20 [Candidatus Moranbacteria bacterium CG23_combo_of_CG06-09_8_20_14_all_35_22]|nr:MAG: 30S ribosomal protein S20 [Candidatus Moranbacteria bacterium CG23_combo_of_CG06-09_8_20_14_all_35_22]